METNAGIHWSRVLRTDESWVPLVLRATLGLVILPHGAQKLFGAFGGYGFEGTMEFFTETVGIPWLLGLLIIGLETLGTLFLMSGLATRILALSYLFLAIGIVVTSHIQHGFFMNWYGTQEGEGYEFFLLWIGIASSLLILGGGKYSLDRYFSTSD